VRRGDAAPVGTFSSRAGRSPRGSERRREEG
jgi:hypothetical protein